MSAALALSVIAGYFLLVFIVSWLTGRQSNADTFFTGNRSSPWYLVAFGMVGASLSGVTFISVPGQVSNNQFAYMQIVFGYAIGYAVIMGILLPLYYRLNLTSIYTYLEKRFGQVSYKTGAFFFLISRVFGSAARLYLAAMVLQLAIFDSWHIPFEITVALTIALIWIYTYKGGIKTIVWTDALQTAAMLSAVAITLFIIADRLDTNFTGLMSQVWQSSYSQIAIWDSSHAHFLPKDLLAGAFIAIAMTGLDQDMMQKNLTCRSLGDAQKNMFWFTIVLVIVNFFFLALGAALYLYADQFAVEIPERTDSLYPLLALNHFGVVAGLLFLIGIIAAAYSSADSALAALTTSFCFDFLNFDKRPEADKKPLRIKVHLGFSVLLLLTIIIFKQINNSSVITAVLSVAGYTYGPLLGMFAFGIFFKMPVKDKLVPIVCVASPLLCFFIQKISPDYGYTFGFELLLLNAILVMLGLWSLKATQDRKINITVKP